MALAAHNPDRDRAHDPDCGRPGHGHPSAARSCRSRSRVLGSPPPWHGPRSAGVPWTGAPLGRSPPGPDLWAEAPQGQTSGPKPPRARPLGRSPMGQTPGPDLWARPLGQTSGGEGWAHLWAPSPPGARSRAKALRRS
jgi:hypothetical protein